MAKKHKEEETLPVILQQQGCSFCLEVADGSLTLFAQDSNELRELMAILLAFSTPQKIMGPCRIRDLQNGKEVLKE